MKLQPTNRMFEGLTTKVFNLRGEAIESNAVIDLDNLPEADIAHFYAIYQAGDLQVVEETPIKPTTNKQTKE